MIRVVIIAPILARYDAISNAAIDRWRVINALPGFSATLLTASNDHSDIPAVHVGNPYDLLMCPDFMNADVIIYHFGIYAPLHDGMILGNGKARQVVVFHNVTPAHLLAPEQKPLIDKSISQMFNFTNVDEIWADSPVNAETLGTYGLEHPSVHVVPLIVETPERGRFSAKAKGRAELLYIGRMVKSKGILDLLQALDQLRPSADQELRLRLVGNETFSDPAIIAEIRERAARSEGRIELVGEVAQTEKNGYLAQAHILAIPSYHEGFCIPVVEGLRAGCVPVGYDAYNIPNVCAGLGRLVAPGDIDALAEALLLVIDACQPGVSHLPVDQGSTPITDFDDQVDGHVAQFTEAALSEKIAAKLHDLLA